MAKLLSDPVSVQLEFFNGRIYMNIAPTQNPNDTPLSLKANDFKVVVTYFTTVKDINFEMPL